MPLRSLPLGRLLTSPESVCRDALLELAAGVGRAAVGGHLLVLQNRGCKGVVGGEELVVRQEREVQEDARLDGAVRLS